MYLVEVKRQDLINKSKQSQKGRERFNKRNRSHITNTVKAMNSIDMNKLFKEDILTVNIPVQGETDNYTVKVSFGGFLELLRDQVQKTNNVSFREISRAAIIGFNKDDVFIQCTCEDFQYRFNYWATQNKYNSGAPENRPADITNPQDKLGSSCKHTLLVINNTSWILRVARTISNYIEYMKKHYEKMYADIIYPAVYGKKYEQPVQLDLQGADRLETDTDIIDKANIERQAQTKFKKNNTQGIRFSSSKLNNDQLEIENPDDKI